MSSASSKGDFGVIDNINLVCRPFEPATPSEVEQIEVIDHINLVCRPLEPATPSEVEQEVQQPTPTVEQNGASYIPPNTSETDYQIRIRVWTWPIDCFRRFWR